MSMPRRARRSRAHDPAEQCVSASRSRPAIGTFGVALGRLGRAASGIPTSGETRVLAAAADQIGGSLERDRLQRDATSAEVSRRSEALKSALLDSVSHDLRTPLASIRAAAGTLMDPDVEWPAEQRREIAASIDREAEWLNRLVTNLLDMSRVEAGELRPEPGRLRARGPRRRGRRAVRRSSRAGHRSRSGSRRTCRRSWSTRCSSARSWRTRWTTPRSTAGRTRRSASRRAPSTTGDDPVTVEDGGPGVPPETLPRLFEKFYRVPRKGEGSRRGTGIGLAVVRGLVEAMGGRVEARASELGGLAIELDLPIAAPEPGSTVDQASDAGQPMTRPHDAASILLVEDDDADATRRSRRSSAGTATTSPRPPTRPRPLAAWEASPARPDRARPRPARPRRSGGHPARPARGDDADPGPVGPGPRGGQGRRAGPRRGRLRDEAVRHGRAAGADRRPASTGGRAGGGRRRARSGSAS